MSTKIVLNKKQIQQLNQIAEQFQEINRFTLVSDSSNGIGPVVKVHFTLFSNNDANVDITDVNDW